MYGIRSCHVDHLRSDTDVVQLLRHSDKFQGRACTKIKQSVQATAFGITSSKAPCASTMRTIMSVDTRKCYGQQGGLDLKGTQNLSETPANLLHFTLPRRTVFAAYCSTAALVQRPCGKGDIWATVKVETNCSYCYDDLSHPSTSTVRKGGKKPIRS